MIDARGNLIGNIEAKISLQGQLNKSVELVKPTTQTKTVEPSIEEQVITPDEGVFALSSVTVNPVTSEIDENIKAENIKEGISILGVEGSIASSDYNVLYDESSTSGELYKNITEIGNIDTSNRTNFQSFYDGFSKLNNAPTIDTSKGINFAKMYGSCTNLKIIPSTDTSNGEDFGYFAFNCYNVETIPQLDLSKANNVSYFAFSCRGLINCGGFKNLGKSYLPTQSSNYSNYTLDLSSCSKLTEQSIINILNGLFDIASIGVQPQSCKLGSKNIAKLTSEEGQQALANAQAKGWNIS